MTVIPLSDGRHPVLTPRTHEVILEDLELIADIGFHDFEVGVPQRLLATVRVRLDLAHWPEADTREASWNYDFIRTGIHALMDGRRFDGPGFVRLNFGCPRATLDEALRRMAATVSRRR